LTENQHGKTFFHDKIFSALWLFLKHQTFFDGFNLKSKPFL